MCEEASGHSGDEGRVLHEELDLLRECGDPDGLGFVRRSPGGIGIAPPRSARDLEEGAKEEEKKYGMQRRISIEAHGVPP
jgi:hypothetical protein